jgi:hypothetical protein
MAKKDDTNRRRKTIEYDDYDIQMSLDSNNKTCIQVVGIRDGAKDILKEFDRINFIAGSERAFAAPSKDDTGLVKLGGAFVIGLLIGGVFVYVIMKNRFKNQMIAMSVPPPVVEQPMPARPENDMARWIAEYEKDLFTRGD